MVAHTFAMMIVTNLWGMKDASLTFEGDPRLMGLEFFILYSSHLTMYTQISALLTAVSNTHSYALMNTLFLRVLFTCSEITLLPSLVSVFHLFSQFFVSDTIPSLSYEFPYCRLYSSLVNRLIPLSSYFILNHVGLFARSVTHPHFSSESQLCVPLGTQTLSDVST